MVLLYRESSVGISEDFVIYTHRSRVGDVIVKSNFYSCLTFFYALLNQLWICYLGSYKQVFYTSTVISNWKLKCK